MPTKTPNELIAEVAKLKKANKLLRAQNKIITEQNAAYRDAFNEIQYRADLVKPARGTRGFKTLKEIIDVQQTVIQDNFENVK